MRALLVTALTTATLLAMLSTDSMADKSPGCAVAQGIDNGTYTMVSGDLERTYRVHVPTAYQAGEPAPLVVLFHGWSGDENDYLDVPMVREKADRRGYILVAPRGIGSGPPDESNNSWSFRGSNTGVDGNGDKTCDDQLTRDYAYPSCRNTGIAQNGCAWTHCQGPEESDVDFALALIDEVAGRLCVDTGRIYAAGSSNGGMFTWELAQNTKSASRFRAIAPNIGLPHRGYLDTAPGGVEIPVLLTTGTLDKTVPPGGWEDSRFTTTIDGDHFYYASATAITRAWASSLGCVTDEAAAPVDTGLEDVDCRSYCSSDPGLTRVLDCRAEMGHDSGFEWAWGLTLDFFDQHAER